jgi:hypothetical protein
MTKETPMRLIKNWTVAIVAVAALYIGGRVLADVVCRRAAISGFDTQYAQAKNVLGKKTTSDIKTCEVFVTKGPDDYLYFHSNFISDGFDFPTKIATDKVRDLTLVTANLLYAPSEGGKFSPADTEKIIEAHKKYVKYFFDQTLFDTAGKISLDLGGADNLYVLFDGAPPPKRLTRLNPIRGPPYVAEYDRSLFVPVTSSSAPQKLFSRLEMRPFKSREIRFVSMIPDSATESAIKTSAVSSIREQLDSPSKETLQDLFRRNSGRIVVLLGHVEGENFVATDAAGKNTLFTLSLTEIEQMAVTAGCDAIMLGCSSALAGTSVGVNKPFNPVDAVGRLAKALNASNYLEFVRTLSNEDMGLVFTDSAFDQSTKRVDAEVYTREAGRSEPVVRDGNVAGRVALVLAIAVAGTAGSSGGSVGIGDDRRKGKSSGHDDKRDSSGNAGGAGSTKPDKSAKPGTTKLPADSQSGGHPLFYIIVLVAAILVVGWAVSRMRSA